jgi:3-oxoacyl-[acyl-carrier-protein] synthase II
MTGSSGKKRVVITGMGVVSPVGIGSEAFWAGLLAGKNGIGRISKFDTSGFRSTLAAEVVDYDPLDWMDRRSSTRLDRFSQFAVTAATLAYEDADLGCGDFDPTRAGIAIGSGIGGSKTIEDGYEALDAKGARGIYASFISRLLINMAASVVSIKYGLKGPILAPSVACSTGALAIGDAFKMIQRGAVDIMLAGGSEACIEALPYAGFCAARAMSTSADPDTACRPFDGNRDGFVMGEGAGIVVLEDYDHALKRGAEIMGEIIGYGNAADAFHLTAPSPNGEGMARSMNSAIADAGIRAGDIGYVNAHGTSTVMNDKYESAAIDTVFGEHASRVKVSSTKSMTGHLMAASGAIEFIATVLSLKHGTVHPTINYEKPDPDCAHDYVVSGPEEIALDYALTNSFGFGGGNVSLVAGKI